MTKNPQTSKNPATDFNPGAGGPVMQSFRRPYTFDRVVRIVISVALIVLAVLLVERLSGVLLPFLVSWLIAYMLEPLVQRNRRVFRLKGRFVAIVLTLLEVVFVITALCVIFLPGIMQQFNEMGTIIARYADVHASIPFIPQQVHDFLRDNIDFRQIGEEMGRQDLQRLLKWSAGALRNSLDVVFEIFSWCIVFLYVIFIMLDYDRLIRGFRNLVPRRYRRIVYSVAGDVTYSMNHYFRGQALVSLCVGIIFAIGFLIVGLPLGIVLGLFIGVLNMVPYLQLISIVPTTLLCLVCAANGTADFWTIWIECMAVYIICQIIQDMFLTPKIMGKYMGLNPAIILLSLSVWGSLLGLIGLIIALPLTTLLLSYYNRYIIGDSNGDFNTPGERRRARSGLREITDSNPD